MAPSDSNGVYSLPDGSEAVTGEVIQAPTHNNPIQDLASAMSARLMRSGVAPMTGALKVVDGSVGSPAVQFNSASSTGFYKTANGIGVSIGGVKVAEFTTSGLSRMIGEIIPWTLLSAPSGWVLTYGQTLSRTTYADLWTIAQTEIAAGNTFFNNGDGSTTFGIGDLRGRVVAGKDNMGGTSANRLTDADNGLNGDTLGDTGGVEKQSLVAANLPSYTPSGSVSISAIAQSTRDFNATSGGASDINTLSQGNTAGTLRTNGVPFVSGTATFTGVNNGGTSTAFGIVQPTIICNYILYVGA